MTSVAIRSWNISEKEASKTARPIRSLRTYDHWRDLQRMSSWHPRAETCR